MEKIKKNGVGNLLDNRITRICKWIGILTAIIIITMMPSVEAKAAKGDGTIYPNRTGYYFFTLDDSLYRVDLYIGTTQTNNSYWVTQSMTLISGSGGAWIESGTWTMSDGYEKTLPDLYDEGDRQYRLFTIIHYNRTGYHVNSVGGDGVQSSVYSYTDSAVTLYISTNDCGITNWYDGTWQFYNNTLWLYWGANSYTITTNHYIWSFYTNSWEYWKSVSTTASYGSWFETQYLTAPTGYYQYSKNSSGFTVTGDKNDSDTNVHYYPCSYTLKLNANGGTTAGSSGNTSFTVTYTSMNYNDLTDYANASSRTGYTFKGWYTASSGGTQVYNASGKCTNEGSYWSSSRWVRTSNATLYAQWEIKKYTVTIKHYKYNVSSGSYSLISTNYDYNINYGTNYIPNYITPPTGYKEYSRDTKTVSGNITVNCYYYPKEYTMSTKHYKWNPNTSSWDLWKTTTESALYSSTYTPSYATTPNGYYNYKKDGYKSVTGNTTFNCYYYPNTYTIYFKGNKPSNAKDTQKVSKSSMTILYSQKISDIATASLTGYSFKGWKTKADGTGSTVANGTAYSWTSDITVYAQWEDNEAPVDSDNGSTNGDITGGTSGEDSLEPDESVVTPTALVNTADKLEFNWVGTSVKLRVKSSDDGSGISSYKLYDSSGNVVAEGIEDTEWAYHIDYEVTQEGVTEYKAVSIDNSGNSHTLSIKVRIDYTAPSGTSSVSAVDTSIGGTVEGITEEHSGVKKGWVRIKAIDGVGESLNQRLEMSLTSGSNINNGASYKLDSSTINDEFFTEASMFEVDVYVMDNVGNTGRVSSTVVDSLSLSAYLEKLTGDPDSVWQTGESGKVNITTSAYVESVEVIYPSGWVALDAGLGNRKYDLSSNREYEKSFVDAFTIPLYSEDGDDVIIVKATKLGREKTVELPLSEVGATIDDLKYTIKMN